MSNLCPKEDLEAGGIVINAANSQNPQQVLAIVYPEFDSLCNNLFKTYLTKDVFLDIKNKKTAKLGNSIRPIIQAGLENQGSRIGCYMTDSEAYETYQNLVGPIIEEINQGVNVKGFKYVREHPSFKALKETKLTGEMQYIKSLKVKVKRNLGNYAFNLVNNNEIRERIREKLLGALKKLHFEKIYQLEDAIDEEEKKSWLNNKEFFNSKKNPFIRQGARFKDWPHGRALDFNNNKKFFLIFFFFFLRKFFFFSILAWINKEDHLELISINPSFRQAFEELYQLLDKLDEELHFAFSEKFGFITTKPGYVGIGLNFTMRIEISEEFVAIFQENLNTISPNLVNIEIKEHDASKLKWTINLKKPAGMNLGNVIPQLESIIYNLFNGIVNKDPASVKTKKGITFETCLKNKAIHDEECYDLFQQQIIEKMIVNCY